MALAVPQAAGLGSTGSTCRVGPPRSRARRPSRTGIQERQPLAFVLDSQPAVRPLVRAQQKCLLSGSVEMSVTRAALHDPSNRSQRANDSLSSVP